MNRWKAYQDVELQYFGFSILVAEASMAEEACIVRFRFFDFVSLSCNFTLDLFFSILQQFDPFKPGCFLVKGIQKMCL